MTIVSRLLVRHRHTCTFWILHFVINKPKRHTLTQTLSLPHSPTHSNLPPPPPHPLPRPQRIVCSLQLCTKTSREWSAWIHKVWHVDSTNTDVPEGKQHWVLTWGSDVFIVCLARDAVPIEKADPADKTAVWRELYLGGVWRRNNQPAFFAPHSQLLWLWFWTTPVCNKIYRYPLVEGRSQRDSLLRFSAVGVQMTRPLRKDCFTPLCLDGGCECPCQHTVPERPPR